MYILKGKIKKNLVSIQSTCEKLIPSTFHLAMQSQIRKKREKWGGGFGSCIIGWGRS